MLQFSVLMSIYQKDDSEFLDSALKSIWDDQIIRPSEIIIVVDGYIGYELVSVLDKYCDHAPVKLVKLPTNIGLGQALNEGLKYCNYDLVARMDSDDISKPHRFQTQLQIFENDSSIDVVGAWVDEFCGSVNNVTSVRRLPQFNDDIFRFAKMRNPLNHPVVMFNKNAVFSAGGYLHFPFFEDYYLWVRMLCLGKRFYNCQESLLFFRFSESMISRRKGLKYALIEHSLLREFVRLNFIPFMLYVVISPIKLMMRLFPTALLKLVYVKLLR